MLAFPLARKSSYPHEASGPVIQVFFTFHLFGTIATWHRQQIP